MRSFGFWGLTPPRCLRTRARNEPNPVSTASLPAFIILTISCSNASSTSITSFLATLARAAIFSINLSLLILAILNKIILQGDKLVQSFYLLALACLGVKFGQGGVDLNKRRLGHFLSPRQLVHESGNNIFLVNADHGIKFAAHSQVREIAG